MPKQFVKEQVKNVYKWLLTDSRGVATGGKVTFDHIKDYRYVYPSFKKLYGVDLNKESITWWEYKMMLEGCFINECTLKHVISIRTRKIPPKADQKEKENLLSLKHKYKLQQESDNIDELFKTLKGVANNGS